MSPTRHLFQVPSDADLPPLAGTASGSAAAVLERLLEELLDAAGANIIPAPALVPDPPNIVDAFEALRSAARRFEVATGIGLADHFWTHPAALAGGEVGARLAVTARGGRSAQGFLALYATEIRSPVLYAPNAPPVRVRAAIAIPADIGGPYLALIMCEPRPDGSAEAVSGFAMPIYHARRFVPIRSDLDRDVLRALEHLQVTLDAQGADCSIQRIRPRTGTTPTRFVVTIAPTGGTPRHFSIAVDPAGETHAPREPAADVDYSVTLRNWRDGGFVKWLEAELKV